jgi:mannonate dehydratase
MVGLVRAIMHKEARRRNDSWSDHEIPMHSNHGHLLADDIGRKVKAATRW